MIAASCSKTPGIPQQGSTGASHDADTTVIQRVNLTKNADAVNGRMTVNANIRSADVTDPYYAGGTASARHAFTAHSHP